MILATSAGMAINDYFDREIDRINNLGRPIPRGAVAHWNAAWNILSCGAKHVGAGRSESTPVETALPTDTDSVSAKHVVEAGSPPSRSERRQP